MLDELITRYPSLNGCKEDISAAINALIDTYDKGGKLMLCGNGGSASDSGHIVGELMKGFLKKRPLSPETVAEMKRNCPTLDDGMLEKMQCGLPAISLVEFGALNTAVANDNDPALMFAQPLYALAKENDAVIGISTSGNSKNVVSAIKLAKAIGIKTIGLTGAKGGKLKEYCDICICVPETETYKIQELHLPVYHEICAAVEAHYFEK